MENDSNLFKDLEEKGNNYIYFTLAFVEQNEILLLSKMKAKMF